MDLAMEAKRDQCSRVHDSICEGENQDDVDSVDENFATWESEKLVAAVQ